MVGSSDSIFFDGAHNFRPGDAVHYAPGFGNLVTVGGLNLTDRYFVIVVDDRTIKLAATHARALNPLVDLRAFTPSSVSGNTITISGHGLSNGDSVTYDAPDPLMFPSIQVDAERVTGSAADCDDPTTEEIEEDCIANRPTRNNILFLDENGDPAPHSIGNGDLVLYGVTSLINTTPLAIGNLTNGKVYKAKVLSSSELQLRPTTTTTHHFERPDSNGSTDRIVRTDGGSFITDGFRAGTPLIGLDELEVSGTSGHNGTYTITSVTASTITLSSTGAFKATRNRTELFFDHVIHTCSGSGCTPPPPTNHIRRTDGANWTDVTVFTTGMVVTVDGVGTFTITGISGNTLDIAETVSDSTFVATIHHSPITATLDGPVIDLEPDKSEATDNDVHTLIRTTHRPIGGLVDGRTYYVVNATANSYQLALTPGGPAIALDTTGLGAGVVHLIGEQAIDIESASGEQELRIDITSNVTGTQKLLAPGGLPLSTIAPNGGDGLSSATSTGSGRGAYAGGDNLADVNLDHVVNAYIGSSTLLIAGGNVSITSSSTTNTNANVRNDSGGLVSNGETDARIQHDIDSQAYVGSSAVIVAGGNVTLNAFTSTNTSASSNAKGGAIILSGAADADSQINVDYLTAASVQSNADILAGGLVTIGADTGTTVSQNESDARGGGFALNGRGDARALTRVGHSGGAETKAELGSNATIEASRTLLQATGSRLFLRADADGRGAGLRARGDGESEVSTEASARVVIGSGAKLTGIEGVDLIINWRDVNTHSEAFSRSSGLFGRVDSDATNNTNLTSEVSGASGATVSAGPRRSSGDGLAHPAGFPNLAFYIDVENGPNLTANARAHHSKRSLAKGGSDEHGRNLYEVMTIPFNSNVNILSGLVELVVDATGTIAVAKGITVNGGQSSGVVAGPTISVDDIGNAGPGDVVFMTNNSSGAHGDSVATISGGGATWTFKYTLERVRIINLSTKTLQLNDIEVLNEGAQPLVWLSPHLPSADMTLEFNIARAEGPTLVDVRNLSSSNVLINGTIDNPIGTTSIVNTGGDVLATKARDVVGADGRISLIRTHTLRLETPAVTGDVGQSPSIGNRLPIDRVDAAGVPLPIVFKTNHVSLVTGTIYLSVFDQVFDGQLIRYTSSDPLGGLTSGAYYFALSPGGLGIQLAAAGAPSIAIALDPTVSALTATHTIVPSQRFTVETGGDAYLDVEAHRRDGGTGIYVVVIDAIHSGGDIDILLRTSVSDPGSSTATVVIGVLVKWPDNPDPGLVHHRYFTPDLPGGAWPINAGFGRGAVEVPIAETTYDFRQHDTDGVRRLPGLIAGGNIIVTAARPLPTDPFINVLAITDILALGHVDVLTNGWINVNEKFGDLRVGRIMSTANYVVLYAPVRILDALDDNGPGVVADVTGTDVTFCAGTGLVIGGTAANPLCFDAGQPLGGVGEPTNFIEVNSDVLGTGGLLTALDTFADATAGIYLSETAGDMRVKVVHTLTDVSLNTVNGSILDAHDFVAGEADVIGKTIDIDANGGSIGSAAPDNDLEIDSQRYGAGDVSLEADVDIYLTEVDGELRLVFAQAFAGDIRLTVRESSPDLDEDLILLPSGDARMDEDNLRTIANGYIWALNGWILLLVGDDMTDAPNTTIRAGEFITIYLDNVNLDADQGTVSTFYGEITPGPLATPGGLVWITQIFGHVDDDSILFDKTYLGGKTRVYGSNTSSRRAPARPRAPAASTHPRATART